MVIMVIQLVSVEEFNFAKFAIVMETLIQMLLEIVTEQQESVSNVFTTLTVLIAINVYQDILEILSNSHTAFVKHVHVIHVALMKISMEFQSAIKYLVIVNVNLMSSERIVMNVKTDFGISKVEKDAKIVNAILSDHTTHRVTLTPDNVSANQVSQEFIVTNVKLTSMVSRQKGA